MLHSTKHYDLTPNQKSLILSTLFPNLSFGHNFYNTSLKTNTSYINVKVSKNSRILRKNLFYITTWLLAQKWCMQNMPLEKIYFGLLWIFWIPALPFALTCTIKMQPYRPVVHCHLTGGFKGQSIGIQNSYFWLSK